MARTEINVFLAKRDQPPYSQAEIARTVGLAYSTVNKLLLGKLVLEGRLNQIAGLLGIARAELDRLIRNTRAQVEDRAAAEALAARLSAGEPCGKR